MSVGMLPKCPYVYYQLAADNYIHKKARTACKQSGLFISIYQARVLVSEHQSSTIRVDDDRFLAADLLGKKLLREVVEHIVLNGSLHRTGTEFGIVACIGQPIDGGIRVFEREALRSSIFFTAFICNLTTPAI